MEHLDDRRNLLERPQTGRDRRCLCDASASNSFSPLLLLKFHLLPCPLARPPTTMGTFSKNSTPFHYYLTASLPLPPSPYSLALTLTHTSCTSDLWPFSLPLSLSWFPICFTATASHTCNVPQAHRVLTNTPNR